MLTREQLYNKMGVPQFLKLILEFNQKRTDWDLSDSVFTLKDEHHSGLVSLKRLFVSHTTEDPSEGSFAEAVFGDVSYWLRVREYKEFKPFVEEWRKEADILRKSKAFKAIIKEVEEEGRNSYAASKYLIEEPWKGTTKAAKTKAKETATKAYNTVSDDYKRLKEEGFLQ